jgi:hypothetical protein
MELLSSTLTDLKNCPVLPLITKGDMPVFQLSPASRRAGAKKLKNHIIL